MFQERVQYKKLMKHDKVKAKAEFPKCLQSYSDLLTAVKTFFIAGILFAVRHLFYLQFNF